MKLRLPFSARRQRPVAATGRAAPQSAFTMVEIALCLAIIGFALVAIIGVLPKGMNVQRENREETIINQDASIFIDAIRNGARGLDDLTNYVFAIMIKRANLNVTNTTTYINPRNPPPPSFALPNQILSLTSGSNIVGLLGTPKYEGNGAINQVVAFVHAISGAAAEKPPQNDPSVRDISFSYRLVPEIVPVQSYDTVSPYGRNLGANLHELRLTFRWPLLPNGNAGSGRQVFRTMVGGQQTNAPPYWFFRPQTYVKAQ